MYDNYSNFLSKASVNSPMTFKKSPQKYAIYENPKTLPNYP